MVEPKRPTRLAIIDPTLCKPKQCQLECARACPVNKTGKLCLSATKTLKMAQIVENLCIGCGACVKKCPFKAIKIVNLPGELDKDITMRYGQNGFRLHRLPVPRRGKVVGLVGTNGIGKSTCLNVLGGERPNLGKNATWTDVIERFKGNELQGYFQNIHSIKTLFKPQHIDEIAEKWKGQTVKDVLQKLDVSGKGPEILVKLSLEHLLDHHIETLSGGELQRFSILITAVGDAEVYIFDEPSSYLDVKQRIAMATVIRSLLTDKNYIVVVEHDLAVLDMLCDYGCVLYGSSGAYGVVTAPYAIRVAINIFLDGFVPTENVRFRDEPLKFNVAERPEQDKTRNFNEYQQMMKSQGKFTLHVESGYFSPSEITVLLGENGTGKTTLISLIAGISKPDPNGQESGLFSTLKVSVKPQKIRSTSTSNVRDVLMKVIRTSFLDPAFISDVLKPLCIDKLYTSQVSTLSGGELQRLAIAICLGKDADIYALDEPSAYLDSDQRISVCKVLKRFIYKHKKTCFVVEHDLIMAAYLADRIINFVGVPGVSSTALSPVSVEIGMNLFLKNLNITFRRDPANLRPRVNKIGSMKDREQKENGQFFFCKTEPKDEEK